MVTVLLVLAAIFLLAAMHPFVTYPLSLQLFRRLGVGRAPSPPAPIVEESHGGPRFAVCMCAYNEERVIEEKMRNLLALRAEDPEFEILVYVDAASDRTAAILGKYGDRIRLFVSAERRGKTHGMNLLVAHATAPILVFTDANVMLDGQALRNLAPYFADPGVGCVCGHLIYTNDQASVTASSGSLYWRFEEALKRLEQATGSVMGADGSLFAIRRALHRAAPDDVIDDMYVSFMILCGGHRIVQAPDMTAYEASASSAREEFHRKARIACQAFNVHRLLWPRIRWLDALTIYKYVSHKLLRWFTIYFLALSFTLLLLGLAAAGRPVAAIAVLCVLFVGLAAGHVLAIRPFGQIVDLLIALAGAGLGVWHSLRGRRYQTWTPAASVRKG